MKPILDSKKLINPQEFKSYYENSYMVLSKSSGIVVIIDIVSVNSQKSFNIETLHGWIYHDIKHVVCHDSYI